MVKRDANGYAVGGLSGGESKDAFWRIVKICSELLPKDKPRYCMGVGYSEDLVVCSALGIDMYDCVFPTRTARFGNALTRRGALKLRHQEFERDESPIDQECECHTCKTYSRSYLSRLVRQKETVACHLVSIHNIAYQLRLMRDIRRGIEADAFPAFVQHFMKEFYHHRVAKDGTLVDDDEEAGPIDDPGKQLGEDGYPIWIVNALESVGIKLLPKTA